jgi:signal transduction histidine kinase
MSSDLELLCLGAALVVDTVLLLAMLERRNWRYETVWIVLLTVGAWLWHAGAFSGALLEPTGERTAPELRTGLCLIMTAGLLLMPCALVHGVARLWATGTQAAPRLNARFAFCYLPMAALVPIGARLSAGPPGEFFVRVEPFVLSYFAWITVVNVGAAAALLRLRRLIDLPRAHQFFGCLAVILLAMTAIIGFVMLYAQARWSDAARPLQLLVSMLPVAPAMLFAYYVIRFRFVPLVLERTLVYGAILAALMLFHRLAVQNVTTTLTDRYRIDFGVVEGMAGLALVLIYQPLRQRIGESLQYLLGWRVAETRDRIRQLAIGISERAGEPPDALLAWFAPAVGEALSVEWVGGWLIDGERRILGRHMAPTWVADENVVDLYRRLAADNLRSFGWSDAPDRGAQALLQRCRATAAVRFEHQQIRGLLLLGRQSFNQEPTDEEMNALLLLTEQLAVTMHNSRLQSERLWAERRALLNEKLSTLGLLAGSIAHEVRNPLSSIKTIASVLSEELGPESPHTDDLRLILSEIDRLSATTTQLLEFARPREVSGESARVEDVLGRMLQLMRHFARQRDVSLDAELPAELPAVTADEPSLREIFFNLLSNSIEAAGAGGRVKVSCRRENGCVVAEVRDSGPGLAAEVRARLFEPFVTTKASGTGLGLYVVSRRVREAGGRIRCDSGPEGGTSFVVELPCFSGKS